MINLEPIKERLAAINIRNEDFIYNSPQDIIALIEEVEALRSAFTFLSQYVERVWGIPPDVAAWLTSHGIPSNTGE